MKCPNCGKDTVEGAKFCGSCGAPLASVFEQDGASQAAFQTPPAPAAPLNGGQADGSAAPFQTNSAAQPQQNAGYAAYEVPAQPADQNPYTQNAAGQQGGYYQAPQGQAPYGQPASPYSQAGYQPGYAQAFYPVSETDRVLRLINFILCLLSTIACGIAIIPLCWMIPMTVISWGIYKGKKANTVAFGVCTLIFVNIIGGVLLLCSNKDIKR